MKKLIQQLNTKPQNVYRLATQCICVHSGRNYFKQKNETQAKLFVEGNVKVLKQFFESSDKKEKAVLKRPLTTQPPNPLEANIASSFLLESEGASPMYVNNFSSVFIIPGVLKNSANSREEILAENMHICLLGDIFFLKEQKLIVALAPIFFGQSKQQIIEYLQLVRENQIRIRNEQKLREQREQQALIDQYKEEQRLKQQKHDQEQKQIEMEKEKLSKQQQNSDCILI